MACNYFVGKDWDIAATTGRVVEPFVAPNLVTISIEGDSFTVTVTDESTEPPTEQSWDGFKCEDDTLSGTVVVTGGTFQLLILPEPGTPNRIKGEWDPAVETTGTWTGNEGGGPSEEDRQRPR